MKHLKPYIDFDKINEEEGWKENILVGLLSLFGVAAMGQVKDPSKQIYKAKTETAMKSMLNRGWQLDSTQVDTLWREIQTKKPDTLVMTTKLMLDKDQYFASGKFELSQTMKDAINTSLDDILAQGGLITDIKVTSSTDKQGLSSNLQKELKSLGYTPDNQGLSKARNNSVVSYLTEKGVNESLIETDTKYEMGQEEIEQSSRYVMIDIAYIIVEETVTPGEVTKVPQIKKTYYLSKERQPSESTGTYKFKGGYKKTKKNGPIKDHRRKHKRCPVKCSFEQ